jgi:alkylation response protein AidB-like acyl-CoA dehydrogenase
MDFTFTEDQEHLRREIVRFCRGELNADIAERDRAATFPHGLWLKCGDIGLHGLPVPEEYGGIGLPPLSTALALEAFGYGCEDGGLVFSVCAHLLACVVPIWKHGTTEQKRRYLPDLCTGRLIAVNGMTEPNSGSDAFAMTTRAIPDGDGFRLNGTKTFSTNGPVANVALTYAVTDPEKGYYGGVTAFLVDAGATGFTPGQKFEKMGLRTSPIGELVLEDVYVPREAVVGGVGGGSAIFSQSMQWERICLVACHIGTMERLLERATAHARTRTAYGQTIGKFQAISHRIAEMKVRLEAARLLTYRAAWQLDRVRDNSLDASITKLFASESLLRSALDTVQIFGGYGFMTDYGVERTLRDAVASTIYSGTSEVQRNIIARWLGV